MSEPICINQIKINQLEAQKYSKPSKYLFSDQKDQPKKDIQSMTVELIADLLKSICDKNESQALNSNLNLLKSFTTKVAPSISIKNYLIRLTQFTKMEESTMIFILIYIDRINNYNKIQLTHRNIYKLILASALVAIKFNEDVHYSLEVYAKIGGIPQSELENLEYQFLILLQFTLNVDKSLYDKYSESLLSFQDDEDYEEESEEEEKEEEERNKEDDKCM